MFLKNTPSSGVMILINHMCDRAPLNQRAGVLGHDLASNINSRQSPQRQRERSLRIDYNRLELVPDFPYGRRSVVRTRSVQTS